MNDVHAISFSSQDGALQIKAPFGAMRIRWHPKPLAEELVPGARHWRVCWPTFRLLMPEGAIRGGYAIDLDPDASDVSALEEKRLAFDALRAEMPTEFARIVEPFVSHQWALLTLLHEQPLALDLARTNPVVAYCCANSDEFRGTQPCVAAIQALMHSNHKQRKILAWLGFPDSEAMVRIMRKIMPGAVNPSSMRRLRNAIGADGRVMALLAHLPRINAGALALLSNTKTLDLVTPNLLAEVAAAEDENAVCQTADQMLEWQLAVRGTVPNIALRPFRSRAQVRCFHEEREAYCADCLRRQEEERLARLREQEQARIQAVQRAREQDRIYREKMRNVHFEPPIPGTDCIIPLTAGWQLQDEGRVQNNCVGGYIGAVTSGKIFVYRIIAPERATLSIVRGKDGCWRRLELEARSNRKARKATQQFVDAWLAQHQNRRT